MAGAGQPWYMPAIWPLGHVVSTISKSENEKPSPLTTTPLMSPVDILTAMAAGLRNYILACFCIYYLYPDNPYPGMSNEAKEFRLDWMLPILIRNIVATILICGFWDWFLYFSPLKQKLHKYKITKAYPSLQQIKHDVVVTLFASCCGSGIEILMCYGWANNVSWLQHDRNFNPLATKNILIGGSVTFWRIAHFHILHRSMHPWRTTVIPDVGKFLYRHVHSLHHKSYNPTAFSGTNMHPIEATGYYSAALIPALWGNCHPVFALTSIIDCAIGAWLGHDGFQWPGSGDYFHMLHHRHFDCNYGAVHIPLDWLFGTFAGCKDDVKKVWGRTQSGEEANSSVLHPSSSSSTSVK